MAHKAEYNHPTWINALRYEAASDSTGENGGGEGSQSSRADGFSFPHNSRTTRSIPQISRTLTGFPER
jgi:hypothetical protein